MFKFIINKKLHGNNENMILDINYHINKGDFVALYGASGSGKTTLLRVLAGLEDANANISFDDKIWQNKTTKLAPQKRDIGFVFQDYALFENMTIEQNLLYVNNDKNLANELLELTNLQKLKNRYPNNLSGGQKQRVSLCRAMMNKPKLLLMDEPLSALDPSMRLKLQNEILLLHKKFNTTTIMVSHDPSEIYRLANKIIVLENGKIIQDGSPKDILLKTNGSAKFSFEGELLDIKKVDVIYIAIVSIALQLVEIVITQDEAKNLKIGQKIRVGTKAFSPTLTV
jgi:molybdate transport system ATP-binding protein